MHEIIYLYDLALSARDKTNGLAKKEMIVLAREN
jgi:hypothetical protein